MGKKKLVNLCIKNNVMIMFMYTDKYLYEYFITCQFQKKYNTILGIFHFFYYLFNENINQEHNLLPDYAFGPFT